MKTVLSTFNFHSFPVRINVVDQEPFFCLLDVATVLGLGNRSVSKFKFNPKGVEKFSTPSNGGDQEMIFINEPNLYRVIFRSNKPEAEKFQNWVFEEVLPHIRKTGKYEHKTTVSELKAVSLSAYRYILAVNAILAAVKTVILLLQNVWGANNGNKIQMAKRLLNQFKRKTIIN